MNVVEFELSALKKKLAEDELKEKLIKPKMQKLENKLDELQLRLERNKSLSSE